MPDWLPPSLRFASDATELALTAAALLVLAGIALLADRRRSQRKRIDAVGWVPWTAIFFACAFCAVSLLTLAVKGWIAGLARAGRLEPRCHFGGIAAESANARRLVRPKPKRAGWLAPGV